MVPASFAYDGPDGQLSSITTYRNPVSSTDVGVTTDANGNITTGGDTTLFNYDPSSGLMDSKQYADGTTDSYHYAGAQLGRVDQAGGSGAGGATVSYGYDAAGEATRTTAADGSATLTYSTDTLDAKGRVRTLSATNSGGVTFSGSASETTSRTLTYDGNDQLQSETSGTLSGVAVSYEYYGDGDVKSVTLREAWLKC